MLLQAPGAIGRNAKVNSPGDSFDPQSHVLPAPIRHFHEAQDDLGWTATTSLHDGITANYQWFREHRAEVRGVG